MATYRNDPKGCYREARWRGCRFVPFPELTALQQAEARAHFSAQGRREAWENIEWWAFAVRKDGRVAKCRYIEPVGPRIAS